MIMELVHTSVRRGLKPGSRGFTTVAHTRGMPQPLIEFVESLSAYRFEFSPTGPQAEQNPVARSHVRGVIGGREYHILSRIAPSGADYSGRANKIAHHWILERGDCPEAGPAWLLAQRQLFREEWEGDPELLAPPPSLPDGEVKGTNCASWAEATGDAGWAGEVIRARRAAPDRPIYLICTPGVDTLRLLAELSALLFTVERWDLTFTSALAGPVPPGVNCQVRCVLDTPGGRRAAGATRSSLVLDLTRDLGPVPPSDEAAAARQGLTIPPPQSLLASTGSPTRPHERRFAKATGETSAGAVGVLDQGALSGGGGGIPLEPSAGPAPRRFDSDVPDPARLPRRKLPAGIAVLGGCLLGAGVGFGVGLAVGGPAKSATGNGVASAGQDSPEQVVAEAPHGPEVEPQAPGSDELGALKGRVSALEAELADAQAQLSQSDDRAVELEQELDQRDSTIAALQGELRDAQAAPPLASAPPAAVPSKVRWLWVGASSRCPSFGLNPHNSESLDRSWLLPSPDGDGWTLQWTDGRSEGPNTASDDLESGGLRVRARLDGDRVALEVMEGELPGPRGGQSIVVMGPEGSCYLSGASQRGAEATLSWHSESGKLAGKLGATIAPNNYKQTCDWTWGFDADSETMTLSRHGIAIEATRAGAVAIRCTSVDRAEYLATRVDGLDDDLEQLRQLRKRIDGSTNRTDAQGIAAELGEIIDRVHAIAEQGRRAQEARCTIARAFEDGGGRLTVFGKKGEQLLIFSWPEWEQFVGDEAETAP